MVKSTEFPEGQRGEIPVKRHAASGEAYHERARTRSGPPAVSVLLPYRDAAETIEEAVESMLAQRGVRVEVICVDDGSRDDGPRRVARLAARHRAVVPLSTSGIGIVGALQAALRAARHRLIARMDGDDVALPDRLALQADRLASEPGLGAVGARVEAFPAEAVGPGLARYVAWQNSLLCADEHRRELFVESPLCHPSVLLRREALEAAGGWRAFDGPEDYDLWLRLDALGFGLAKVPEVLLRWRHLPGRMTFADPRFAPERFLATKAPHLARRLFALGRPVVVWGAGPTGKRTLRALEPYGIRATRFVDIDPRKVGRLARGVPIASPDSLRPGVETVLVAVGTRGARGEIRAALAARGFVEERDFVCAA